MVSLALTACTPIIGAGATFPNVFGVLAGDWKVLTFLALLCSLLALTLIYIFANFLRNQGLLTWCKFELFQALGTATIFIFILVWATGMCEFKMNFLNDPARGIDYGDGTAGNPYKNMYAIVDSYFDTLKNLGYVLFSYAMYISKIITFWQKVTYFSSPLGLGVTDNPLDSLGQLNSVLFFMISGFATSFLLLDLQRRMMEYMAYAALYYFLPFGIFFRGFEPTRGAGGALIGISLAFFLFYPVTLTFNDYMTRSTFTSVYGELDQAAVTATNSINGGGLNKEEDAKNNLNQVDINQQSGQANTQSMISGLSSATIFLIKPVALYMIAAVVLPVINFIVLVEITRGLTKLMGDELDVSNLTRLI